jgi:histone H3/H4
MKDGVRDPKHVSVVRLIRRAGIVTCEIELYGESSVCCIEIDSLRLDEVWNMIESYLKELLLVALLIATDNERNVVSSEDLKMAYNRFHGAHPNFYGAEEDYLLEEEELKQSDDSATTEIQDNTKVEIPQDSTKEAEMSEAISDLSITDQMNIGTSTHLIAEFIRSLTADESESEGEDSDYYEMLGPPSAEEATFQAQKEKEEILKNAPSLVPYDLSDDDENAWETTQPIARSKKRKYHQLINELNSDSSQIY